MPKVALVVSVGRSFDAYLYKHLAKEGYVVEVADLIYENVRYLQA